MTDSVRHRLPRLSPTPEIIYFNRRQFIQQLGVGAMSLAASSAFALSGRYARGELDSDEFNVFTPGLTHPKVLAKFPAPRNHGFDHLPGNVCKLTEARVAATHNNFYEFRPGSAGNLWPMTEQFVTDPWVVEVTGLCHKPRKFGIDDLFTLPGLEQEERTYRFRCVEAWAMDVPWTGFELGKLLKKVEPKSNAKFVRLITANMPEQMPGITSDPYYPWPYFEGLRMDEAMHELTLLVTGIYARPLPRQHGSPFRLIVPWKYGYKSIKSIVKIELLETQPKTFWETIAPTEYPFESNVNPKVPHPRWSQVSETILGTGARRPTLYLNGYANLVGGLYA